MKVQPFNINIPKNTGKEVEHLNEIFSFILEFFSATPKRPHPLYLKINKWFYYTLSSTASLSNSSWAG